MKPLSVDGVLDSLPLLAAYVGRAAQQAGLEDCVAYRLRLAVDEIASNIIVYGYLQSRQEGQLIITATVEAERLVILLEDSSPPFDPSQAPAPDVSLPPTERPEGGLGIFLAMHSTDELRYEQSPVHNRTLIVIDRDAECVDDAP